MTAQCPSVLSALAALEEWLIDSDQERRALLVERTTTWRSVLLLGDASVESFGRTMADALAQSAQIVVADPARIGGAS